MPSKLPPVYVVIPAAGIGSRMQISVPKQYLKISNKTILQHSIECFLGREEITQVIVALHKNDQHFQSLSYVDDARVKTVIGGTERADSVLAGIETISDESAWVMVHDAARPCLNQQDLNALFEQILSGNGAILATPVRDTMKRSNENTEVLKTESRVNLWHALTPQCFPAVQLRAALHQALKNNVQVTDEASAIESVGGSVKLVQGSDQNIKITRPDDLKLAEFYLSRQQNND